MEITEVRIKLMDDPHDRLQGFCSITFDASFVIRDLKIIQGAKGPFVAMPSRKLTDRCPQCNTKNHLRSMYCNQCGAHLKEDRSAKDDDGRAKLYADIAHPINSHCRETIQTRVLESFEKELVRSSQPGYSCTYDDYGEERIADLAEQPIVATQVPATQPPATTVVAGTGDATHRIEQADPNAGGPHRTAPARISESVSPSVESSDDGFGDGIV